MKENVNQNIKKYHQNCNVKQHMLNQFCANKNALKCKYQGKQFERLYFCITDKFGLLYRVLLNLYLQHKLS